VSESRAYELLEQRLGHHFQNRTLLETALTHKSFLNENPGLGRSHNERLEFLGDAVLDLAIGHLLMERFPHLREGELSMTRAQIVNEQGLADVAVSLGIGEWLFLGRGEENTGGRQKPSILADACEALVAAVYLDGGFQRAFEVVSALFVPRFAAIDEPGFTDYKTRLQERVQAKRKEMPRYVVTNEYGPDHDKTFEVAVSISGREYSRAGGKSKKEAEQRAAAVALFLMDGEDTTGQ
jgi:ribonuclease III